MGKGKKLKKYALVIGNSDYKNVGKLKNPTNDSIDIKNALESIGFSVVYGENLGLKEFRSKLREFYEKARNNDITLFYYAGHGLQYQNENYFVPIDADIKLESEISDETICFNRVESTFKEINSNLNIFILDSCRNNPFEDTLNSFSGRNINLSRGLTNTKIKTNTQTIIAYATEPDNIALDNEKERNGIFTKELLKYLKKPIKIEDIFKRTKKGVRENSDNSQIPWTVFNIEDDFYLNGKKEQEVIYKENLTSNNIDSNSLVWEDEDTGLIWQVYIKYKRYEWKDIQKCANKLNKKKYGGFNDWRVPTINELKTLIIKEPYENSESSSGEIYIKEPLLESMNMKYQWFWSSTEEEKDSSQAWAVVFNSGNDRWSTKSSSDYVRCVRGEQQDNTLVHLLNDEIPF